MMVSAIASTAFAIHDKRVDDEDCSDCGSFGGEDGGSFGGGGFGGACNVIVIGVGGNDNERSLPPEVFCGGSGDDGIGGGGAVKS